MYRDKKILGIIPARLESSRVPRKPLHKVFEIPLVEHVYRRALISDALDELVVATDSSVIADHIESIGGKAIITSEDHANPTERICEIMDILPYDLYVLINGDEILLDPSSIKDSIDTLMSSCCDASMLSVKYHRKQSPHDFKIVLNTKNEIMYISRNDIPSDARNNVEYMLKAYHVMTFKPETLSKYRAMPKSYLESIEDHEHLRLLENGYKIAAKIVDVDCISLDTYQDIPIIEQLLKDDDVYRSFSIL